MKTIFHITFINTGRPQVYKTLFKEQEFDHVVPRGVEIEDETWKEPRLPTSIVLNIEEQYCLVCFDDVECPTEEICKSEVAMYGLHGWE